MVTATVLLAFHLKAAFEGRPVFLPHYPSSVFRAAFVGLALPLSVTGYVALRRRAIAPVKKLSLSLILLGTLGLTILLGMRALLNASMPFETLLNAFTVWCQLIIITGVIVLFARFRFADRFLRHCARIVSAATLLSNMPSPWLSGINAWPAASKGRSLGPSRVRQILRSSASDEN